MSRVLTESDVDAIADAMEKRRLNASCDCPLSKDEMAALPEAVRFYRNWNSIFSGSFSVIGRTVLTVTTLLILGIFGMGAIAWVAEKLEKQGLLK